MSDVTSKHRRQLFYALGWEPQDQHERDWIETGVGHIGRSVKTEVMGYELEKLAGAFASFESSVRAELAQARAGGVPVKRPGTPTYPKTVGPWELEPHYSRHVGAMTSEGLRDKADIAFQLALRDRRIAELERQLLLRDQDKMRETVLAHDFEAARQPTPQRAGETESEG